MKTNRAIVLLTMIFGLMLQDVSAQVPQKVLAEHFTNTRCSVCARKNPGFFSNLANHPGVLHMSVHPSSPYSTCVLNRHNVSENDARTRYYGIYGATPRVVIQGKVLSTSADLTSPSIFSNGATSPLRLEIFQSRKGNDSLLVKVTVHGAGSHSLDSLQLFSAILEDTIFYNAPNGENTHHNVFRKALFGAEGLRFFPPANGDSIEFTACVKYHVDWDRQRVYPLALVQESASKAMVQAENARPLGPSSMIVPGSAEVFKIYPNPANGPIYVELAKGKSGTMLLYDAQAKLVKSVQMASSGRLNLNDLVPGVYFLELEGEKQRAKLIIQ